MIKYGCFGSQAYHILYELKLIINMRKINHSRDRQKGPAPHRVELTAHWAVASVLRSTIGSRACQTCAPRSSTRLSAKREGGSYVDDQYSEQ